jgi:hypothetical protein
MSTNSAKRPRRLASPVLFDAQGRACRSESRDTHHEVIKNWAEERGGVPATVEGTEYGDHLRVLRFDFGGDSDNLRHVSREEWFGTFDDRRLNFPSVARLSVVAYP